MNWVGDNLGGLGLPQYLADSANSYNGQNAQWRNYYASLQHREMTAADLGLVTAYARPIWPRDTRGLLVGSDEWLNGDAPYFFWLGAQA